MQRLVRHWKRSRGPVGRGPYRLAYHYAHTDQAAKAVEYLTLVATKAARNYAHAEALTSLQEALRHVNQLSDRAAGPLLHSISSFARRSSSSGLEDVRSWRRPSGNTRTGWNGCRRPCWRGSITTGSPWLICSSGSGTTRRRVSSGRWRRGTVPRMPTLWAWHISSRRSEDHFTGRLRQGVAHAQRAVALLEAPTDPFQHGSAYYGLGMRVLLPRALPIGTGSHNRDGGDWSCQWGPASPEPGGVIARVDLDALRRLAGRTGGVSASAGVCAGCRRNRT